MSEQTYDEFDTDEAPQEGDQRFQQMRQKANEHPKLKTRAEKAERELAILKSGVDTSTQMGRLFMDAYKGDSNPDAVRQAAVGYGLLEAPEPEVPSEERQALERVHNASRGSESAGSGALSLADVEAWPQERRMAYRSKNPEAWEALKRGETVNSLTV